ncbi:MAG: AraC family transcriptional regulator [Treponema sp.]|nr:AraC family transcriptional regulator [Treponema sp.]
MFLNSYANIADAVRDTGPWESFTVYPDGSRQFEDIISVNGIKTADGFPFGSAFCSFLLQRRFGNNRIFFEEGFLTPLHRHNFIELGYVAEGQLKQHIAGRDYMFNQGEMFLINKDVPHREYLYRKNMAVLFLNISNTFFDKSMNHLDLVGRESGDFIRHFIIAKNREYCFVRFVPKGGKAPSRISGLFEEIRAELRKPETGGSHIVIGLVERLLSLLPSEYILSVELNSRKAAGEQFFEQLRCYLEDHHPDVTMRDLITTFGHNRDYFNRIVKWHTGMTYSAFLRSIRLDKAALLLKTTGLPVEEVALRVGYEDPGYFYKIFRKRFNRNPGDMRNSESPGPELQKDRFTPY